MNKTKKFLAIAFSVAMIGSCFAGCSSEKKAADEITEDTQLIAYTQECEPFIYEENGELKGFDVELIDAIFDGIKQDAKHYKFIKVDEEYRLGEDVAYTDENGRSYIAYIMVGGIQKDHDSINKDVTVTDKLVTNNIIAVTKKDSGITDFSKISGKRLGVTSGVAKNALAAKKSISMSAKGLTEFKDAKSAVAALEAGKIDALVIDEFSYMPLGKGDALAVLPQEIDEISYVYALKKWDWFDEQINKSVFELKSENYGDGDSFTPIVEKYFGYDASEFSFVPSDKK